MRAPFSAYWAPRTVAPLNDDDSMVVKVRGGFVWHQHDATDDFVVVLAGVRTMHLPDRVVTLGPGAVCVVPRGVPHRPVADMETHLLVIEPTGTPNTGDLGTAAPRQTL